MLEIALYDLRDGPPALVADAAAWFADGSTFTLCAESLGADPDFLRSCARRVLVRRFGGLQAARLLAEPLARPRRRRRTRVHAAPTPARPPAA